MNARRTPDLHDLVHELTQTHTHREYYERRRKPRYHTTENPPLLVQLLLAAHPGDTQTGGAANSASRPPSNLDPIDTLTRIHREAADWLQLLERDHTGHVGDLVTRLAAVAASVQRCRRATPVRDRDQPSKPVICCTWHQIEADIYSWWKQARIATGWDQPAWRPNATCPACAARGGLRIRDTDQHATCTNCGTTWDAATIGLLAEHVRRENGEQGNQLEAS